MGELTDRDGVAFAVVDDALRTYPLAPPPPTLAPRVMARIRALSPTPRFESTWFDYAVSLFGAGIVGLGLLFWQFIPPQVVALELVQFVMLLQQSASGIWITAFLGGLALAACALVLAAAIFPLTIQSQRGIL